MITPSGETLIWAAPSGGLGVGTLPAVVAATRGPLRPGMLVFTRLVQRGVTIGNGTGLPMLVPVSQQITVITFNKSISKLLAYHTAVIMRGAPQRGTRPMDPLILLVAGIFQS